jgi:hypothetical protein
VGWPRLADETIGRLGSCPLPQEDSDMASTRTRLVAVNDNGQPHDNRPHQGKRSDSRALSADVGKGLTWLFGRTALLHWVLALAVGLTAGMANTASGQTPSDLKARCDQLISYYDRYGVGRSENSDGARNHTRIAAGIDCQRGQYEKGISAMEALLKNKRFDVPPQDTGVAQPPAPFRFHGEKRREAQ